MLYGRRIVESSLLFSTGGTNTLYTCPAGKIFLLIHAFLSGANDTSGPEGVYISLVAGAKSERILQLRFYPVGESAIGMSPSIPVRMLPGESLVATNDTDTGIAFGIIGYEIDESRFYQGI